MLKLTHKLIIALGFLLLSDFQIMFGQDRISLDLDYIDCAHGHICCSSGCPCCRETYDVPKFDTNKLFEHNGINVFKITQQVNKSRRIYVDKYLFIDQNNEHTTYICTKEEQINSSTNGETKHLEQKVTTDFIKGHEMVFNDYLEYFLIDSSGMKKEILWHTKELISPYLYRVSVCVGDKQVFGIVDAQNQLLLNGLSYKNVSDVNPYGLLVVNSLMGSHTYVVSTKGEIQFGSKYHMINDVGQGFYTARDQYGWWLVNRKGIKLNKSPYQEMGELSDGMLSFSKNRKIGFIDTTGKQVINAKFNYAYSFSDSRAAVTNGELWGFIDKKGALVIPYKFHQVTNFSNDRAAVALGKNSNTDKWGAINRNGAFVILPSYSELSPFKNGYAKANINGKGNGIIDRNGAEVIEIKYHIDSYEKYSPWFQDDVVYLTTLGDSPKSIWKDRSGKTVFQISDYYTHIPFKWGDKKSSNHVIISSNDTTSGMMNLEGKILIECKYRDITLLNNKTALVYKDGKYYIYNYIKNRRIFLTKNPIETLNKKGILTFKSEKGKLIYFDYFGKRIHPY